MNPVAAASANAEAATIILNLTIKNSLLNAAFTCSDLWPLGGLAK